jgi:GTPase SAR1 family protein
LFRFVARAKQKDIEEFKIRGRSVLAYDLGGHERVRDVWKDYLVAAGCIVFVVDASDTERFADAKAELDVRCLSCLFLFFFFFTRLAFFFLFFWTGAPI